jgi:hypothetical protein
MYPSIKFKLVQQAAEYFCGGLSDEEKDIVNKCLALIWFGMENTLLTFQDQYYIYDSDQSLDDKGLTIGGYESAWLAEWPRTFLSRWTRSSPIPASLGCVGMPDL